MIFLNKPFEVICVENLGFKEALIIGNKYTVVEETGAFYRLEKDSCGFKGTKFLKSRFSNPVRDYLKIP